MAKYAFPPADGLRHYYLRDPRRGNQPIGCVVFKAGTQPGTVIRGISICSNTDAWDRVEARRRARKRCRKAEIVKQCADEVKPQRSATAVFLDIFEHEFANDTHQLFKAGYDVPATSRESRILTKEAEYASKKPDGVSNS